MSNSSYNFMAPVVIVPTGAASSRTRNRIREHNLKVLTVAKTERKNYSSNLLSEKTHTLFRCVDPDCEWIGWLPNNEIEKA